jgi:hypothetical protein
MSRLTEHSMKLYNLFASSFPEEMFATLPNGFPPKSIQLSGAARSGTRAKLPRPMQLRRGALPARAD